MSSDQIRVTEVLQLADAYFDGNIDAEGIARLEHLLDTDMACLHAYVERTDFHGKLLEKADPQSDEQATLSVLREFSEACERREHRVFRNYILLSAASLLLVGCGLSWMFFANPFSGSSLGRITHLTSSTVTSSGSLELGKVVRTGDTITVDQGVLSFELAHVVLDLVGPAQLKLKDETRVQLLHGTLTAHVLPGGEGFTVSTNDAEIVDLGTEFSVRYDLLKGTEVSVRRGKARVSLLDYSGAPSKILDLTTSRAARFERSRALATETAFDPQSFREVDRTRGTIRSITGQFRTETELPASLLVEETPTPNHMLILPEKRHFVLTEDLEVDTAEGRKRIAAGTSVSSYLVHYDPTSSASFAPRGSITFFGKIAAVVTGSDALQQTDPLLGSPQIKYETRRSRGLEQYDELRISDDQRTVSFFFRMDSPEYQDQTRIIVID
ncbi:FecR domain-containing protein [Planctomicrobium sp. SH661]|uniref:FecR domain-containing protein n=1 Tax=Planctomicrobium sp. SH661 TaxID=3448124 RepID=UPI003F5C13CC